jgi:alkanesulfonate monooxygenase SsuD/methylene tetrahydromethanopterin reductase-like flavin-dependent oxidoreductase (luciferase family)
MAAGGQALLDVEGQAAAQHVAPEPLDLPDGPLPVQRPIPVWIGGYADIVMERIGRLADGWFPGSQPGDALERSRALVVESARAAGRDPSTIGMEGRIPLAPGAEEQWIAQTEAWRAAGATHMSINTMGQGRSPAQHIETIRRYAEVVSLLN